MTNSTIPHIPNAELQVMQVIWDTPVSLSVKQLIHEIQEVNPNWKTSTIRTLIDRLVVKGCLAVHLCDRVRYYTALTNKQAYLREVTKKFLLQHYSGSVPQMFILVMGDRLTRLTTEERQQIEVILTKLNVK